jgi:DnaJ-class molecular chaperone
MSNNSKPEPTSKPDVKASDSGIKCEACNGKGVNVGIDPTVHCPDCAGTGRITGK